MAMTPKPRGPTSLSPLGTGRLMPALVLGYEASLDPSSPAWARWTGGGDVPPWLMFVMQQAGGYCMSYWDVLGVVLRLEANAGHARRDPTPLLAAFHAMAEDPRPEDIRRHQPELLPLCGTWGDLYTPSELRVLSSALATYFDLSACEWGMEAFVRLERAAPTSVIGWRCVEPTPGTVGIGEDWPGRDAQWLDGGALTEHDVRALTEIGTILLAKPEPPSLYLIWENSD